MHSTLPFISLTLVAAAAAQSGIRWVDCKQHVPVPVQQRFNITTGVWNETALGPLPDTLQCAELDVPMDYTKPLADNNTVTLGFAMNRPANATELLNFNPGGPGVEVASFAWFVALNQTERLVFEQVANQNLLAMDVRSTSQSTPLNCSSELASALPVAFPNDTASFAAYQAAVVAFAHSCLENSSPPGLVEFVGSQQTVQDWDTIRQALGFNRMSMLSVSYGTFQAAEYVNRFPAAVDRFVLDAVTPHDIPGTQEVQSQIAAVNRLVLRADAFCAADPACAFHGAGRGAVPAAFRQVIASASAGQLGNLTAAEARFSLFFLLNSNPDFPAFNAALAGGLKGDTTLLRPNPVILPTVAVSIPIICADEQVDGKSFEDIQKLQAAADEVDTLGVGYSLIWQLQVICTAWPFAARPKVPRNTSHPLLFVTADFDLNTPTELANFQVGTQAPNSTLLVRHGDDHGTFELVGLPAQTAMFSFLRTGTLPPASSNEALSVFPPGTVGARNISDPYAVAMGVAAGDKSALENITQTTEPAPGSASNARDVCRSVCQVGNIA